MLLWYLLGSILFASALCVICYSVYYLTREVLSSLISESRKKLYESGKIASMEDILTGIVNSKRNNVTRITIQKNGADLAEIEIDCDPNSNEIQEGDIILNYN